MYICSELIEKMLHDESVTGPRTPLDSTTTLRPTDRADPHCSPQTPVSPAQSHEPMMAACFNNLKS